MKRAWSPVVIVSVLSFSLIVAHAPSRLLGFLRVAPAEQIQNRIRVGLLSVDFSADGNWIATAGYLFGPGVGLRLWDVKRGMFRVLVPHSVTAAAFSPDGKWIAYVDGGVLAAHDIASGLSRQIGFVRSMALTVAYSADGQWVATGHQDGSVYGWNVKTREPKLLGRAARGDTDTVVFSPKESLIASGGDDQAVRLWNCRTGEARLLGSHGGQEVFGLAWAPDGKLLATAASNDPDSPNLWNVATGERKSFGGGMRSTIPYCAAFAPDGQSFALGKTDGGVIVYQVKGGAGRDFVQTGVPVHALAYSPDGKLLATGGSDGMLRLWDAQKGTPVY